MFYIFNKFYSIIHPISPAKTRPRRPACEIARNQRQQGALVFVSRLWRKMSMHKILRKQNEVSEFFAYPTLNSCFTFPCLSTPNPCIIPSCDTLIATPYFAIVLVAANLPPPWLPASILIIAPTAMIVPS